MAEWARELASARSRESLAIGLEQAVEQADRPLRVSSRAPLNRPAIRANRSELLDLARQLRAQPDPPHRGIELVRDLVVDGTSPLYGRADAESLRGPVERARRAISGGSR